MAVHEERGLFLVLVDSTAPHNRSPLASHGQHLADNDIVHLLTLGPAPYVAPELLGPITVCAYSYMALVPVIQPPIMRLLTTDRERRIRMKPTRQVSRRTRILFPVVALLVTTFIAP